MSLSEAIDQVRTRPDLGDQIAAIRAFDTQAKRLKSRLPGATYAAHFTETRDQDAAWTHTGLMPVDYDLPEAKTLALRTHLQKWPHLVAVWSSPRKGLHVLIVDEQRLGQ